MKCSVYIATSIDGFIARENGDLDWLDNAGIADAEMGEDADMGFHEFINSVDCIVMGRKTMEIISDMNLTSEQWPYGNLRIIVLSKKMKQPPKNMKNKVEIYSGSIQELVIKLEKEGHCKAYIDGGKTIQSFLNLKLITDITLTRAPIILGSGIPLFGDITTLDIRLEKVSVQAFPNNFIQEYFSLEYS